MPGRSRRLLSSRSEWLGRLEKQFGAGAKRQDGLASELEAFLLALEELRDSERFSFRVNRARAEELCSAQVLEERLKGAEPLRWSLDGFWMDLSDKSPEQRRHFKEGPEVASGLFFLQEAAAMEAVEMLDPQPGEVVCDLCAAPGAKSTFIGERLAGTGWLVANDPTRPRAERLDMLLLRSGILNSSVYALDPSSMSERFPGLFDRVLVDAPCSGESMFAKRDERRRDVSDREVAGCARRQFTILDRASLLLRPGGRLVYSTCTYSREENEDVVRAFLENNPTWELKEERRRWPHRDHVAGGYAASLQAPGELSEAANIDHLRNRIEDTAGLMRHGCRRWDGSLDQFAIDMRLKSGSFLSALESADSRLKVIAKKAMSESDLSSVDSEILVNVPLSSVEELRLFLRGEALSWGPEQPKSLLARVFWQGMALGRCKIVGKRMNNLLPRLLRSKF